MKALIREEIMIRYSPTYDSSNILNTEMLEVFDFGNDWFGLPCSESYWNDVTSLFEPLSIEKSNGLFRDLENKKTLLHAFMRELERLLKNDTQVAGKLVEYLLTKSCLPSKGNKSSYVIPRAKLPTRFVYMGFVPDSKTTMELYLDKGWQFTFQVHNAIFNEVPTLKFDIKIIGRPTSLMAINCKWM